MKEKAGWHIVLKVRSNIELESDLCLAEKEIRKLLGAPIEAVGFQQFQELAAQFALSEYDIKYCRRDGTTAYVTFLEALDLEALFRRLSFVEIVIGKVQWGDDISRLERELFSAVPADFLWYRKDGEVIHFRIVPLNTAAEWSDVIAKRAPDPDAAVRALERTISLATQGRIPGYHDRLAERAMSARLTTGHLFHGLHVYKAKFFPRMVRAMLNLYAPRSNAYVLDPYAGSGTALTEATMLGMPSAGVDIDPLSVLIAEAKVILLHNPDSDLVQAALDGRDSLDIAESKQLSLFKVREKVYSYTTIPPFLAKRIPAEAQQEIIEDIQTCLSAIGDRQSRESVPLLVALSDAISRKLKFRFLGLGYGRFSLNIMQGRIAHMFRDNLTYLANSLAVWNWIWRSAQLTLPPSASHLGDARTLPFDDATFDCIVTSPPYMPASSGRENYLKSKALAMTALGLLKAQDVDSYEHRQVGSVHRSAGVEELPPKAQEVVRWMASDEVRKVKAPATASYFHDLMQSLREIRRVLRCGGCCALVIARQHTFYRYKSREVVRVIDNADVVAELALQSGLEVEEAIHVELNKQNAVARPRSLDAYYETILVLRR